MGLQGLATLARVIVIISKIGHYVRQAIRIWWADLIGRQ